MTNGRESGEVARSEVTNRSSGETGEDREISDQGEIGRAKGDRTVGSRKESGWYRYYNGSVVYQLRDKIID